MKHIIKYNKINCIIEAKNLTLKNKIKKMNGVKNEIKIIVK